MSQFKPWSRLASSITLAAFSCSLVPYSASAERPQQLLQQSIKDIQSGLRLANQSKHSRDVIEFIQEELSENDVRDIVAHLQNVDVKGLPTVTAQGMNIRFGKASDNIPDLRVIDADAGHFRWGKKELFIREGMSFEEFYLQFSASLEKDSSTKISSILWNLFVSQAHANDDEIVVVPDHAPPAPPEKKGLSTGAKIAIAVGVVLLVAVAAFVIYKIHKNNKDKEEREAKKTKKKEKKEAEESDAAKDYNSVKQAYDNARGDYEFRCGSYPSDSQLWSISPDGATQTEKVAQMTSATSSLSSKACESTSTSSTSSSH